MSARETYLGRGTDGSRPPCCNPAHGENRGLICSHSSYSSSRLVDVVVGRLVDVLRSWLLHPSVSLALVSLPKEFTYAALSFFGCLCILVKKMGIFRDSCQSCSALDVWQKHLGV